MKRTSFNKAFLKKTFLAVPAAAMMLGAAHAGTTVGINFSGGSYGAYAYYNSSILPQYFTGFPVTATAFGVAPADWSLTGTTDGVSVPSSSYTGPYPYTGPASGSIQAGPGGAITVNWNSANTWGTLIDFGLGTGSGASYVPPPGDDEVTWGMMDNTGWSFGVTGLNAQFPDGYVLDLIGAGKVDSSSIVTITEDAGATTVATVTFTLLGGRVGLGVTPVLTNDAITAQNDSRDVSSANSCSLGGFIITDVPVVSQKPVGGLVASGGTLSLSAGAVGIPPLSYQWRKNGADISGATLTAYTKAGASTGDSGDYDVVVTNLYGAGTSVVATVTVAVPATVTWDADTGTTGAQDGNGTWDATASNWWNGSADVAWGPLDYAVFGAGGTGSYAVNLGSSAAVSGLTFNGNYTITNSGGQSITLSDPSGSTTVAANSNATLRVAVSGIGLTKTGNGTLTLATTSQSLTGTLDVQQGGVSIPVVDPSGYWNGQWALAVTNINLHPATTLACDGSAFGWGGNSSGLTININHAACQPNGAFGIGYTLTGGTITGGGGSLTMGRSINGFDSYITSLASSTTSLVSLSGGISLRTDTVYGGTAGAQTSYTLTAAAGSTPSGIDLDIQATIGGDSSAAIVKAGSGTVHLGGANSSYGGGTTVTAGTLIVSGARSTGTGAVTLEDNTTLTVTASGINSTIATTAGALTLGSTGTGANTLNFAGLTSTTVAPVSVANVTGINPITINVSSMAPIIGVYPLIKTTSGGSGTLTLGTLPSGISATLSNDLAGASLTVYLVVTAVPAAPTLLWTGSTSGAWDINTTANWLNGAAAVNYQDPDSTIFDDTATRTAITLNTTVAPTSVTVSNLTKSYTLSGSGAIAGFTGLTKNGSGTLTISNANTYSGETVVAAGTLTLADGSLTTSDITNSGAVIYNLTGSQTVGYPISGTGTLTKNGNGTLTMSVDQPITGGVIVNAGTLRVTVGNFAGRFTPSAITVNAGATLLGEAYHALGGGTTSLTLNHGTWLLAHEDYQQNITMMDGLIANAGSGEVRVGYAGSGNLALHVANSVAGSVISAPINTVSGTVIINAARGAATSDLTISGAMYNGGGILMTGNGIVTLAGTNTYTGATTVSNGTLIVNGRLGNTAVEATAAGTLAGTGSIAGPVTIDGGGILRAGLGGIGTLTVSNDVALNAGGIARFTVGTSSSALAITGTLTLDGTVEVVPGTGFGVGTYTLVTYDGGLNLISVSVSGTPAGYACTIDTTTPGQVNLVVTGLPTFSGFGPWDGSSFPLTFFSGQAGQSYTIKTSTDVTLPLSSWTVLTSGTFGASGAPVTYNDTHASTVTRFYYIGTP
jgi:fibronectin-binding autotransporter adhesin